MCSFKNFWRLCWALERKGHNFNATQLQNSKSGAHVWRQYVKKPLKFPIKFVYKMETTRGTSNISAFLNINSTVEDPCSALLHTQRSLQKQRVLLAWSVSLFLYKYKLFTSLKFIKIYLYGKKHSSKLKFLADQQIVRFWLELRTRFTFDCWVPALRSPWTSHVTVLP